MPRFKVFIALVVFSLTLIIGQQAHGAMVFETEADYLAALPAGAVTEAVAAGDLDVQEVQNIASIIVTSAIRVTQDQNEQGVFSVAHVADPFLGISMNLSLDQNRNITVDGVTVSHQSPFLGILADPGTTFDSFTATAVTPVTLSGFERVAMIPEPATLGLLAIGLACFGFKR